MDEYTPAEAVAHMNDLADALTDENWHREASVIWDLIPHVEMLKDRTVFVITTMDDVETFVVNP